MIDWGQLSVSWQLSSLSMSQQAQQPPLTAQLSAHGTPAAESLLANCCTAPGRWPSCTMPGGSAAHQPAALTASCSRPPTVSNLPLLLSLYNAAVRTTTSLTKPSISGRPC